MVGRCQGGRVGWGLTTRMAGNWLVPGWPGPNSQGPWLPPVAPLHSGSPSACTRWSVSGCTAVAVAGYGWVPGTYRGGYGYQGYRGGGYRGPWGGWSLAGWLVCPWLAGLAWLSWPLRTPGKASRPARPLREPGGFQGSRRDPELLPQGALITGSGAGLKGQPSVNPSDLQDSRRESGSLAGY